jgi:hypothetical protein
MWARWEPIVLAQMQRIGSNSSKNNNKGRDGDGGGSDGGDNSVSELAESAPSCPKQRRPNKLGPSPRDSEEYQELVSQGEGDSAPPVTRSRSVHEEAAAPPRKRKAADKSKNAPLGKEEAFRMLSHGAMFKPMPQGQGRGKPKAAAKKEEERKRNEGEAEPDNTAGDLKKQKRAAPPSKPKRDAADLPAEQPLKPINLIIIDDDGQGEGDAEYAEDVTITEKMLKELLKYGMWTCDEVINGYLALVQQEVKRGVVLEHTYIQEQILGNEEGNLDTKISMCQRKWANADIILMPVHIHNNHWVLVEIRLKSADLWVYESHPSGVRKKDVLLWEKIGWFVNKVFKTQRVWTITSMECPEQVFDDCGPFMLCTARYRANKLGVFGQFAPKKGAKLRQSVLHLRVCMEREIRSGTLDKWE